MVDIKQYASFGQENGDDLPANSGIRALCTIESGAVLYDYVADMFPHRVDEDKLFEDWPDDTYRFGLAGPPYRDERGM